MKNVKSPKATKNVRFVDFLIKTIVRHLLLIASSSFSDFQSKNCGENLHLDLK